jgi:hypothetical protein
MSKSSYYWSREDEKQLIGLWKEGKHDVLMLSDQLGRTPDGIRKKLSRLGVVVDQTEKSCRPTTSEDVSKIELSIPDELPSVEEALKLLVGALDSLSKPGLSRADIQRLRSVVGAVKTYQKLFGEYVEYRKIERNLVTMRLEYDQLRDQLQVKARAVRKASRLARNATCLHSLLFRRHIRAMREPASIWSLSAREKRAHKSSLKLIR